MFQYGTEIDSKSLTLMKNVWLLKEIIHSEALRCLLFENY